MKTMNEFIDEWMVLHPVDNYGESGHKHMDKARKGKWFNGKQNMKS